MHAGRRTCHAAGITPTPASVGLGPLFARPVYALARGLDVGQGDLSLEQELKNYRDFRRHRPGGRPSLPGAAVAADEFAGADLTEAQAFDGLAVQGRFHGGNSSHPMA